jgi:cytochrome oxidase Cu insertion factor (SCO1/SenC/PrrC family)
MPAKLKELQPDEKVWTRERIMSVAASLAVILPVAIVSVSTAATPTPANANAPAPVPAVTAAPPAPDLPPAVSVVPLKDVKGSSFKLADFFGKVQVVNLWATCADRAGAKFPS